MKLIRAAFLTFAVTAAGFAVAGIDAKPAMAWCKYGSGDCIDPRPNFDYQVADDVHIPEDNWVDPDCEHYGNCNTNLQTGDGDDDPRFETTMPTFGGVFRR
jgi:hypothetical protein